MHPQLWSLQQLNTGLISGTLSPFHNIFFSFGTILLFFLKRGVLVSFHQFPPSVLRSPPSPAMSCHSRRHDLDKVEPIFGLIVCQKLFLVLLRSVPCLWLRLLVCRMVIMLSLSYCGAIWMAPQGLWATSRGWWWYDFCLLGNVRSQGSRVEIKTESNWIHAF